MSDSNKYIALTLGPITRTIEMAENTRGLWAASYLFSYLGKKIIEPFKNRPFLLPKISEEMFKEGEYDGAGIFPDRYIFRSVDGDFDQLVERVNKIIGVLADEMTKVVNRPDKKEENSSYQEAKKEKLEAFLKSYLKIYFFEKDFKDGVNVKESCEKTLALLEMQDAFAPKTSDTDSFLSRFFKKIPRSFLTKDAGLDGGFPSIVEISSNSDVEVPKHPYQRYIAVVKADGDSMGKALQKMNDATKLSEALLAFNKKATKTIKGYNGLPIYTGGDDLLFVAPIFACVNGENATIFTLLNALDKDFHESMTKEGGLQIKSDHPTLSFGVSISYYKYPMFEALNLADSLLSKAKGYGAKKEDAKDVWKNNIVFSVQKHSGQTRSALLHKGHEKVVEKFNSFISNNLFIENKGETDSEKKDSKKILTSVMHSLREKEFLLSVAIDNKDLLDNFFKNNFNEAVHKNFQVFFKDIQEMLLLTYNAYTTNNCEALRHLNYSMAEQMKDENGTSNAEKAAIETVYNALQFIHLVNQRNNERDENI